MSSNPEETRQPRMLAPTQIEAHVTRLTAVREGLRKFEADDGRAVEAGQILEVAIKTLNSEPFSPQDGSTSLIADVDEGKELVEIDEDGNVTPVDPPNHPDDASPIVAMNIVHDDKEDMSEHDWQTHTHEGMDDLVTPHEHDDDRSPDPLPVAPGE